MRILIVEDEVNLQQQLADSLREQDYVVDVASDGEEGLYFAEEYPIDMAIIDLGLPKLDGVELIKRVRAGGHSYPILILTARSRWQEKVEGLEAGADDYLTKPFHPQELSARLKVLLRRSVGLADNSLECGPVKIDTSSKQVFLDGESLTITAFEYRLLSYLMMHTGKVLSKRELVDHIYEEDDDRDSNTIEVFIRRLRKKLDPDGTLNPIETQRGRGYRFRLARNNT
ncbi:response regulator transcription factor [Arenicella xantha]|uniref:Two-component system response regulator PhoP n=1 Tax=Arenicella xantha TaxID=644221 RepID=A0A395JML8_9GAMM|nr:response regulator transcription factor [Arenicella xantha]RBP50844.1 two-component system response regulator PhoP [Arenicella xantha]